MRGDETTPSVSETAANPAPILRSVSVGVFIYLAFVNSASESQVMKCFQVSC